MFDISYTHSTGNGSNAKQFSFTGVPGMKAKEKIPPQAQHIIQLAYALSLDQPIFTYAQLIEYIEECCAYDNTTFTTSKGGTERIVRYYSALLQSVGILTDITKIDSDEEPDEE